MADETLTKNQLNQIRNLIQEDFGFVVDSESSLHPRAQERLDNYVRNRRRRDKGWVSAFLLGNIIVLAGAIWASWTELQSFAQERVLYEVTQAATPAIESKVQDAEARIREATLIALNVTNEQLGELTRQLVTSSGDIGKLEFNIERTRKIVEAVNAISTELGESPDAFIRRLL